MRRVTYSVHLTWHTGNSMSTAIGASYAFASHDYRELQKNKAVAKVELVKDTVTSKRVKVWKRPK